MFFKLLFPILKSKFKGKSKWLLLAIAAAATLAATLGIGGNETADLASVLTATACE